MYIKFFFVLATYILNLKKHMVTIMLCDELGDSSKTPWWSYSSTDRYITNSDFNEAT